MIRHEASLDCRAAQALEKARGSFIEADPSVDWCVIDEAGTVRVIPGDDVPVILASVGLAPIFPSVERERLSEPFGWVPALVCIDGNATFCFIETFILSQGGAA